MRKYLLTALLSILAFCALLVFGVTRLAAPERHGFPVKTFPGEERADVTPAEVVDAQPRDARPNIVLILADDLGYGDLGAYGGTVIETPHIDRIAREGMLFTEAYSSAPVCSPSRAGLLTGRYPLRSGIMAAMQMAGDTAMRKTMHRLGIALSQLGAVDILGGKNAVRGLPPSEITLAEALQVAGYRTQAIGKWHLGDFTEWPEYHPHNHGFDRFTGFNGSNDDFPVAFWRDDEQVLADIGADQEKYTRVFTEEAVEFIEADDGAPFFIYLSHKDPHLPFFPSEPFDGRSDGGPYGDAVEELDWSTGEVLAALERVGEDQNTIVIFTSDNGPWFDGATGGLRGRKGQTYEGGFRVPLLIRWPGHVEAGSRSAVPTMNIDLLPTLLSLAGVSPPSDRIVDGANLSDLWLARASRVEERALYFAHDYDIEAIRRGPWKYIHSISHYTWPVPLDKPDSLLGPATGARDYTPPGTDTRIPTLGTWPLLYEVTRDPEEAYDVSKKYPEVVEALDAELAAFHAGLIANPRGWR